MKIESFRKSFKPSPKNDIKNTILGWFRSNNCNAGHVFTDKDLFNLSINWNPKQMDSCKNVVKELLSEGLIQDHPKGLALTAKGVDQIYSDIV
jgi:hypothetical protein